MNWHGYAKGALYCSAFMVGEISNDFPIALSCLLMLAIFVLDTLVDDKITRNAP